MKVFVSWSGGKETSLACYKAIQSEPLEVSCLLNMVSEDGLRSRSHGIDSRLLHLQAGAIGLPIVQRKSTWQSYENEFKAALAGFKKEHIAAGIFGDIDMQEHRDWVERVCKCAGMIAVLPLWQKRRERLLKEFVNLGFKAIVVCCRADLLGQEWLGRQIDTDFIADLKKMGNIDLCGEKGEYHTFVYDGPIFKRPVEFIRGEKVLKDKHWFLELKLKQNR